MSSRPMPPLPGLSPASRDGSSSRCAGAQIARNDRLPRLVLAQRAVDGKSSEITAIPQLHDMLDTRWAIVSIDAMGTQKAIAAQIVEKGADYVLASKGNQASLHDDVRLIFADPVLARSLCAQPEETDAGPPGSRSACAGSPMRAGSPNATLRKFARKPRSASVERFALARGDHRKAHRQKIPRGKLRDAARHLLARTGPQRPFSTPCAPNRVPRTTSIGAWT